MTEEITYYQNLITTHQQNIETIKSTTNNQEEILGEEFLIDAFNHIINELKKNT